MDNENDVGHDINHKELQQKIHYSYLSQLQDMARELPLKYQQRLPYDLLSSLSQVLLDGTVFAIVSSLREVQQLEERNVFNQRLKLTNEHKLLKQDLLRKHKELLQSCVSKPHSVQLVETQCQKELHELSCRCEETLKKMDMEVIRKLDQQVIDQQQFLEKASVPGFTVTNNPAEIQLQMYLLEFITKLNQYR